ncbi:Endonuclease/exonuclease/phosphatase [Elaphomyces granulatus]
MFDTLEADIVVFQETKIQKRDLRDDMVLIPGWDCYFSLPRFKKGYSGVVIYTRNATCAPIRAEEGVTGVLCPPNSSISFRDLPEADQIGGYPTAEQLSEYNVDATTLDSEGRCVILEFPAFVLLGVYSPANRDETRDDFRLGFVAALDARVRNLIAMGKRVLLTGDINISRGEIDSAHVSEAIRKGTATEDEYVSTPARRIFNQLLSDGKVIGKRDESREFPVLHDICRSFHPTRKGMYTCWEQRINARPGNYGARIDYVLCSLNMKDCFSDSNIQEGLLGSDHCPVYAMFKDIVTVDGREIDIRDITNPLGMFKDGLRQREYSTADVLPLSGRLIPEFDRRRNIKDMFFPKSSRVGNCTAAHADNSKPLSTEREKSVASKDTSLGHDTSEVQLPIGSKRSLKVETYTPPTAKRSKSGANAALAATAKGQKSLKGFFKSKNTVEDVQVSVPANSGDTPSQDTSESITPIIPVLSSEESLPVDDSITAIAENGTSFAQALEIPGDGEIIDPIASKESWSKLFSKKATPRCEGHQEPCTMLTTKKPGVNCGRAFWMCPRPIGPSGGKEKGTEWRCPTFIWASDWNAPG